MYRLTILFALALTAAHSGYPVGPGQGFRDRHWSPELVVVPGGRYLMGSPEAETAREGRKQAYAAWEHLQTEVMVPTLAVGKYDITRADYDRFVRATRHPLPAGCTIVQHGKWVTDVPGKSYRDTGFAQTDHDPVACVSWDDAAAYAAWLSTATGHRYRLLHEVEWEYAARGGTATARWWGDGRDGLCAHVNGGDRSLDLALPDEPETNRTCSDGFTFTSPVDHFPANPFGLHDMIGNIWQWTADCFSDALPVDPAVLPDRCERRAIRGGSWHNPPAALRAANRFWLPHGMVSASLGFRIVRLPDHGSMN